MTELDAHELDAVMAAVDEARRSSLPTSEQEAAVTPYDLTNPGRLVPDPMPVLEAAQEALAAETTRRLVGRTRRDVSVRSLSSSKVRADELFDLLAPPAVVIRIELRPTRFDAVMILDLACAEALLGAGLGAAPGAYELDMVESDGAAFTRVEERVLLKVLDTMVSPIEDCFEEIVSLKPRTAAVEPDPRLAMPISDGELALLAAFELRGELTGRVHLAIPFGVFEPRRSSLIERAWPEDRAPAPEETLARTLGEVPVEVRVALGRASIPLTAAQSMQPGQLLSLDTTEHGHITASFGGRDRLLGRPTVADGRLAFHVLSTIESRSHGGAMSTEPSLDAVAENDAEPTDALSDPIDLGDVPLELTVELGRAHLSLEKLGRLHAGSVIPLEKPAGEPLDITVNGRLVARGEAVVVGERFGVRISEIVRLPAH